MQSRILLVVALIAISVGLFGIFLSQKSESEAPVAKKEVVEKFVKIYVIAKANVEKGQVVQKSDFKILKLTEKQANDKGFDKDSLISFEQGSVYRNRMRRDDSVYSDSISQPNDSDYIDLILEENHIPYPIEVSPLSIVGGVINPGSYVDVLALAGVKGSQRDLVKSKREQVSISPILLNIKVLKANLKRGDSVKKSKIEEESFLILELDRQQVAILKVAENISKIEIHKSLGNYPASKLNADAGDVLPDFKAIKELRASKVAIN